MNTQVHDTTGASPYEELVFGQKARSIIFPTQQSAIVLEEDLADEGIDVGFSSEAKQATVMSPVHQQAFPTEEEAKIGAEDAQCSKSSSHQVSVTKNVVNGAKDTQHADVSVAESETIERELLEENHESDKDEVKSNGDHRNSVRENALSTLLKHKEVKNF